MKVFFLAFLSLSLSLSIFSRADVHAAKKFDVPLWIGVEPLVMKNLSDAHMHAFSFLEVKQGESETYFRINESELDKLSHFVHHRLKRCGGFRVLHKDPAAESLKSTRPIPLFQKASLDDSINQENLVESWFPHVSTEYMNSVVTHLSSYKTRYYKSAEGVLALKWIGEEWGKLTQNRTDAKVEYYQYQNHDQPTVILTLEGSEPVLKDQVIILGGHGDSINTDHEGADSHAPGADDNAAGIAVLSDIIRVMIEQDYRPLHTIQFIAYAAEEVGIQGSYELARVYRERNKEVIGVLQFDGVNYNVKKTFDMALISDNTDAEQNNFLAKLMDRYLKVKWTWEECGYACSDHAAWNYEGYRASFPVEAISEEQNPHIHTDQDTFDKANGNTEHAALFTKLGMAYLIELDR